MTRCKGFPASQASSSPRCDREESPRGLRDTTVQDAQNALAESDRSTAHACLCGPSVASSRRTPRNETKHRFERVRRRQECALRPGYEVSPTLVLHLRTPAPRGGVLTDFPVSPVRPSATSPKMVERLNDVGEKDDVCSESHNIANTTNDGTRNDGDGCVLPEVAFPVCAPRHEAPSCRDTERRGDPGAAVTYRPADQVSP